VSHAEYNSPTTASPNTWKIVLRRGVCAPMSVVAKSAIAAFVSSHRTESPPVRSGPVHTSKSCATNPTASASNPASGGPRNRNSTSR